MTITPYDEVRGLVMTIVSAERANGKVVTADSIHDKIAAILGLSATLHDADFVAAVDAEALQKDIESSFNVFIADANFLSDDGDHVPWLVEGKDDINWKFWNRYKQYLLTVNRMPVGSVAAIDDVTDMILGRLESPGRQGAWDRRGLVAGQVQSGKTGNYIGLMCKAIDAQYKLVIVLAGIHNSLRAQTQARVDEGVLGFSTEKALRSDLAGAGLVGVGHQGFLHVNSFTSRKETGDFSLKVAETVGVAVGGADPVVLVVKKNKSVLTNILKWATSLKAVEDPETGRMVVQNVPILIIDDEADQASVDTNGPKRGSTDEYDPPVINGLIRKLLNQFQQSAYVGYTATPFANIFIDPDVEHDTAGKSLFPQSFILSLPAPTNYVGPSRVFGLKEDVTRNIEPLEALPMVRSIEDYETWIPDRHGKEIMPGDMPDSLRDAILSFVLTVAVRRWRGQRNRHNSMLVHVTRFTAVQKLVRDQVIGELDRIKNRIEQGDPRTDSLWLTAQALFEDDFVPTARKFASTEDVADQVGPMPTWRQLEAELRIAVGVIGVREVNGTVKDSLDYVDHPEGLNVIAVGGAKLSRGLTLEGLSVSYYLAGSRMYDTLMQMGRWFGYRPGYLDLCRLYTTDELNRRYGLITAAAEELYREFDYMVALGSTPREFGLRVQQHPDGLMVTAANKMRTAQLISMSFAGGISESVLFDTDSQAREANWVALEALVLAMPKPLDAKQTKDIGAGSSLVWTGVPAKLVTAFLDAYRAHPDAYKVQPKPLREYILGRNSDQPAELTDWWVLLANSTSKDAAPFTVGGIEVGLTKRQIHSDQKDNKDSGRFPIRRLISPPHERIDMRPGNELYQEALDLTTTMWENSPRRDLAKGAPEEPAGVACRRFRPATRGILLLYPLNPAEAQEEVRDGFPFVGFALSFPGSEHAKPVDYQVTKDVWQRLVRPTLPVLDEDDDEDDAP
ncbi:Z1 domain-containing protein [Aeromicrobium sp.]|uniref:Z1 domain-containing protein n=1 Tax=Aeromicrobium sp. TaxID=1871063 RepID=UPI0019BE0BAD|nr:Z1 domain-containing protein [Aeromicrobium sp.]MBC7632573.1 Z1 domain-containing protein [Aeromicrobium sp.]